jgi:inorganic pyrophosphatase
LADDGDALDAVVLGPKLSFGSTAEVVARARVNFIDAGRSDPKWICADAPLSGFERLQVVGFFRSYAVAKRLINRVRGKRGATRYLGWI